MSNREERFQDPRDEPRTGFSRESEPGPRGPETTYRALPLLDRILSLSKTEDARVTNHLLLLRHQLEVDEAQFEEAQKLLAEYEEAYQKLTSPANRIGTYLGDNEEGTASVAMGDGEFLCSVDPKLTGAEFKVGTRVKLNEAYAIVGDLGCWPNGSVVKVGEVLESGRLRVAMDSTGQSSRIIVRGSDLEEAKLKLGDEVRVEPNFRVALEHFPQQDRKSVV